jgi:photosystem II stability/assembly factor-like uncharacterized protein
MKAARRLTFLGLPVLALGLSDGPGPAPRHDAWRIVGPGGGGTMRRPAVSPHDPRVVVEGCDMTGAYITQDGGESWRMFSLGAPPAAFAFDPKDPRVIYATTAALWRSRDSGRTWTMVYPDPEKNTVVHAWTDHADFVITTDDPAYAGSGRDVDIHAVGIDPSDTRSLAIAVSSADSPRPGSPSSPTRLLVSGDGGRTWTRAGQLAGTERVFAFRFVGPSGARQVEAVGETGVYVGGSGAFAGLHPPEGRRITSASFGQAGSRGLLYVTTAIEAGASGPVGGLFVSEDGGRTWRAANGGLLTGSSDFGAGEVWGDAKDSRPSVGPVAASGAHGLVAYVGLRGLKRTADGPKLNGIAKTVDGGQTWAIVHEEADRPSSNLEGSWIEVRAPSDGYSIWFDAPYDLAVAPTDPDVCFATDLFRTYRTRDGGKTWGQVNSARKGEGRWASRGLDVTNTYGIHWDPFDPKRVFLSNTDTGLFRSEDGSVSWTSSIQGVPLRWRNTTYWVDFDPEVPGLMWGAFSAVHDLPRPKMWRGRNPDAYEGGVGVSTDGGKTWNRAGTGAPEMATTHVLVDPASPKGKRTLYATGFGRGVYRSIDGGATWAQKNVGLEQPQPFAWRTVRAVDGTLYLIVARRSERGEIGDERDGGLYRSTDGAEHWVRLTLPAGTNGPNGLAVDPKDPLRLYLAAWGRATPGGDTGGGIFVSTDGGKEWKAVLPAFQHVYDVTIDPRDPAVLYATGFDQSALRSADRGQSWTRIRGFNFKWGQRVIPDPRDPAKIYVTTYGGGVWHGPAKGDPAAAEDVVPSDRFRSGGHEAPSSAAPELAKGEARLEALVEANVAGIHAFQLELARKAGKGDPACWPTSAPSDAALAALVDHQTALLKNDPSVVKAWAEGLPSAFDPGKDLKPLLDSGLSLSGATLPINVFSTYLASAVRGRPRVQVRAIANLYQTVLEVERDGDRLQELFAFYIGLGLPVYVGQLGLPGSDEDLLAVGRQLEGKSCASPVGLLAAEWQIAGRKIWNWGEKNQHIRDARVLAKELLAEPEVAALVPRMQAMPGQKVAVVGHSFTMDLHWSSPSSFVPIVTAMFAAENPKVEFRQFQAGGLTSLRAYKNFFADVVAWKPDVVLLVVLNRTDEDLAAFKKLGLGFKAAGARVLIFDDVHDPDAADPAKLLKEAAVAKEAGITVVEVSRVLAASPDRGRFACLDHIHMTEPYHRLMAKEWLKVLVGARGAALGD